jgi:formyl-CoA transferase
MSITGAPNKPTKIGPGVGDTIPAVFCAFGILAAVYAAMKTGQGQFLDVAMYDAILAFCERTVYQYSYTAEVPGGEGNGHPLLCPFGLFEARDGYVAIACPTDKFWTYLTAAMGVAELASDDRFRSNNARVERAAETNQRVGDWTRQHTKKELTDILGGNIPFGPVNNIADIFADQHVKARGMLVEVQQPDADVAVTIAASPIHMTKTPAGIHARSPLLGEHTQTILLECGYGQQQIENLYTEGVVT